LAIVKTPAKTLVGVVSKNRKIRDRVDSKGQYGRWRLRVMGSCVYLTKTEFVSSFTKLHIRVHGLLLSFTNNQRVLLICSNKRGIIYRFSQT